MMLQDTRTTIHTGVGIKCSARKSNKNSMCKLKLAENPSQGSKKMISVHNTHVHTLTNKDFVLKVINYFYGSHLQTLMTVTPNVCAEE